MDTLPAFPSSTQKGVRGDTRLNPRFLYFVAVFFLLLFLPRAFCTGAVQAVFLHCGDGLGTRTDPSAGPSQPGRPRCLHVRTAAYCV